MRDRRWRRPAGSRLRPRTFWLLAVGMWAWVSCVSVAVPQRLPLPPTTLRITFIDVGQGDAILLQLGELDMMVDTGPPGSWDHVADVLAAVSGKLEAVFLTHPHNDHYGNLARIVDHLSVSRVITNGESAPHRDAAASREWSELQASLQEHHLAPESLKVGDVLEPAPGLRMTVLATGSTDGGEFPDSGSGQNINNDSLVLRVEYGGRVVLLTGDIGSLADDMLVSRYCPEGPETCPALKADILKVPHHGSADYTPRLYDAVKPTWAVVSADFSNARHCLPRVEPLEALAKRNVQIFSTSSAGTEDVVVEIGAEGQVTWRAPVKPVFAWRKQNRACSPEWRPQAPR